MGGLDVHIIPSIYDCYIRNIKFKQEWRNKARKNTPVSSIDAQNILNKIESYLEETRVIQRKLFEPIFNSEKEIKSQIMSIEHLLSNKSTPTIRNSYSHILELLYNFKGYGRFRNKKDFLKFRKKEPKEVLIKELKEFYDIKEQRLQILKQKEIERDWEN